MFHWIFLFSLILPFSDSAQTQPPYEEELVVNPSSGLDPDGNVTTDPGTASPQCCGPNIPPPPPQD